MSSDLDGSIERDENLECEIQLDQPVSSDIIFSVVDVLSKLDVRDRSRVRSNTRRGRQERRNHIVTEKRVTDQGCTPCTAERLFRTADNVFKVKSSRDGKENTRAVRGKGTTMSYADMCLRDSQALAQKCPAFFGQVDVETYALVEATTLANQLNMTQPKLVEKEKIMSKDQRIPMKKKADGLLYFEELNEPVTEKQKEREEEEEEDTLPFDFAENAKTHSNVYERVELSEEKEEQADELRQKYMDILETLQEKVEKQTKRARVDTVEERTGKDGSHVEDVQEADDPHESDDTRPSLYPNAIRVFAVEYVRDKELKKNSFKFRTCPVSVAWKVHLEKDPSNLHWYEILRTDFPCHLYFDLEYSTCDNLNANCDGDALVDTLLDVTRARMKKDFDLLIYDEDIYELDSTSAQKFSRHLIIKVPGYAFYSSVVVGEFVSQICADSGTSLLVQTKDGRQTYFVDTAVYTKNRLFRMVYNCKAGKTSNLMPTGRFAMTRSPKLTPAAVFSETLLMSVDESSTLLLVRPPISMIMARRGANSMNGPESRGIKTDNEYSLPNKAAMAHLDSLARAAIHTIEQFASDRAKLPTTVRNYKICGGYGSVAYNLQGEGAHFCSNKGESHKNNFVYIVANFCTLQIAQKCYDTETCSTYKSASSEMPEKFRWDPSKYE